MERSGAKQMVLMFDVSKLYPYTLGAIPHLGEGQRKEQ